MAEKISTRIAVGLSMLVALFALLAWDHTSGHAWGLGTLVLVMTTWGGLEMSKLLANSGAAPRTPLVLAACVLLVGARVVGEELGLAWLRDAEPLGLVLFAFALLFPPLLGTPSREAFLGMAATVFALFYVWFLGSFVVRLRYLPQIGEAAAFYAILVAKGSDICAYFTGKFLGRTKLIPNVSPGKTVAGFVGGVTGGVLITAAFCMWTPLGSVFPLRWSVAVGILMALVAIKGDLVESYFKRSAELKDSARLLPTFGGILDVTDSILTAAPAAYYLILVAQRTSHLGV